MSAHEFMNMARVRAEQAEARAEKAEAEVARMRPVVEAALAWDEGGFPRAYTQSAIARAVRAYREAAS